MGERELRERKDTELACLPMMCLFLFCVLDCKPGFGTMYVQTLVHAYSCTSTHAAFDLVALFHRFSSNLISVLLTGSAVTVLTFLAHDFGPHILQVSA